MLPAAPWRAARANAVEAGVLRDAASLCGGLASAREAGQHVCGPVALVASECILHPLALVVSENGNRDVGNGTAGDARMTAQAVTQ
eukprot:1672705-Prymnesium_polylepis.1